jgi:signal transduction histidine kinase
MGGQFSLSENDPRGTTVTLTLPADSAEASRAASAEQELSSTG